MRGGTERLVFLRTFHVVFWIIVSLVLSLDDLSEGIWQSCTELPTLPGPIPKGTLRYDILRLSKPTTFVTSLSVSTSAYLYVDALRQSALYHEYILIGPGFRKVNRKLNFDTTDFLKEEEEIILFLYEADDIPAWKFEPDIVQQNLGKQLIFSMMNSSGMHPAMTVVNTTYKGIFQFHVDPGDTVSYNLAYPLPRSLVTIPPFDVIIEFPGETKELRTLKTMIDYYSFGLLRWRYSIKPPVEMRSLFPDLGEGRWPLEFNNPLNFTEDCVNQNKTTVGNELLCSYQKRFKRLENPCIKDMFLFYLIRGDRGSIAEPATYRAVSKLYFIVPMVYNVLHHKGWYDLTPVYCARPENFEECGEPKDVVLTNDHLLILTDKGLWVSASLNSSRENVSLPYIFKPLLKFTPIDPCAKLSYFNCSQVGSSILSRQLIKNQRLFYTPVCHLFQYPFYDDVVVLVFDHISQTPDLKQELDVFTILYSTKPYNDWKILVHARHEFETIDGELQIKEVIGVFFNHHRRHFDISLVLVEDSGKERTFRFILPEPTEAEFSGYPDLNGLLGDGHLEFEFPPTFHMTKVVVNPEPLDVFFLGNQIWVAETGNAFPYLSVPYVINYYGEPGLIDSCSFNHPDRTYVCVETSNRDVLIGRVGFTYSAIAVDYRTIPEFIQILLVNAWPIEYRKHVVWSGHFIAGYSGKVMLWYLYNEVNLVPLQQDAIQKFNTIADCLKLDSLECQICNRILEYKSRNCKPVVEGNDPHFRMLALTPKLFTSRDTAQHGPLVPYMVDGDKGILFEAEISTAIPDFYPDRNYMHDINTGNRIFCRKNTSSFDDLTRPADSCAPLNAVDNVHTDCELYIRHIKTLKRNGTNIFLSGFRASLFVHILKAFPMHPIPADVIVLIHEMSNQAVVQVDTSIFEVGNHFFFRYGHIGQTLYIPEQFSILLEGFPRYSSSGKLDFTRMVGIATKFYRQGARIQVAPFRSFLINMKTDHYCDYQYKGVQLNYDGAHKDLELQIQAYRKKLDKLDKKRQDEYDRHRQIMDTLINRWPSYTGLTFKPINVPAMAAVDTYEELENKLLITDVPTVPVTSVLKFTINPNLFDPPVRPSFNCKDDPAVWSISDGGCHLRLFLIDNPVIQQGGGRISLDKYDSLSFTVKLRSLTPLGKSLTHRPLIGITNTNPKVLQVEKKEQFGSDPQTMDITLTPTGFHKGVAAVSVRPYIVSTKCPFAEGGFTIIVQVHRTEGRRLHVNYPIPTCKPTNRGQGVQRPWKLDLPTCITQNELLENENPEGIIRRPDTPIGQIFFKNLPPNYRPPSLRGAEIPLSRNVYNVHPELPKYKDTYRISKETSVLSQCLGKSTKKECDCNIDTELSDDVMFTDCKRKVYRVKRGQKIEISAEYDRVMRDEDQNAEFFSPKRNWSVYLEEVNDRVEFALSSPHTLYLDTVNNDPHLHEGRKFYDMKDLDVTLHGTGLFHFRVGLADFESFDDVTGYFMMYCDDSELDHVQLVVIMLCTITICMVFVFLGFLIVRNRLASQLPFQTDVKTKVKLE